MATPEDVRRALETQLGGINSNQFDDLLRFFRHHLKVLVNQGLVTYGPDEMLGDAGLELRIHDLLAEVGLVVTLNDLLAHDGVVLPPDRLLPAVPIVLEIKSGKGIAPSTENLRQLDDWVFELSGEAQARKHGLGGGGTATSLITGGMLGGVRHHPHPHKGVMIYNGPLGVEFERRLDPWLGPNERTFSERRNFCIVSFQIFLKWMEECRRNPEGKAELWRRFHSTAGVLSAPT